MIEDPPHLHHTHLGMFYTGVAFRLVPKFHHEIFCANGADLCLRWGKYQGGGGN